MARARDNTDLERMTPTSGRLALYFGVRYATPAMVLIATAASSTRPDPSRLTAILSAQVLIALASHLLALRGGSSLRIVLRLGIFADALTITALVALTGGPGGPLAFLYTVHAASSGILISSRTGMRALLVSTLAILALDLQAQHEALAQLPEGLTAIAALWILGGTSILFSSYNERELRRHTAELGTIRQVTLDIEASLSLTEIFADLCRGVVESFGFDTAAILQREGETLRCTGSHNVTGAVEALIEPRGGVARALTNPRPLVVTGDQARRDGALVSLLGPRGYIAVRIAEDGLLVATRSGRKGRPGTVRAHEIQALDRLAHHARLAIANAVLHARVSEMAKTDPLTGLANHGEMQRRLAAEMAKVQRYASLKAAGHHPSVVLLDIDHFKRVNDKHGHLAGDAVLRQVARILKDTVRQFDIVARYGGEEFAVILPGTNAQTASEVAERVRRAIAAQPLAVSQDQRARVTVSAGIATAPENGSLAPQLMQAADQSLYRSKEAGRNRVTHASDASLPVATVLPMDARRPRREPDEVPARAASRRARARSSLPRRRTPHA